MAVVKVLALTAFHCMQDQPFLLKYICVVLISASAIANDDVTIRDWDETTKEGSYFFCSRAYALVYRGSRLRCSRAWALRQ